MSINCTRYCMSIWNDWKIRSCELFLGRGFLKTFFRKNWQNYRWRNSKNYSTSISRMLHFTVIKKRTYKRVGRETAIKRNYIASWYSRCIGTKAISTEKIAFRLFRRTERENKGGHRSCIKSWSSGSWSIKNIGRRESKLTK